MSKCGSLHSEGLGRIKITLASVEGIKRVRIMVKEDLRISLVMKYTRQRMMTKQIALENREKGNASYKKQNR